MRSSKIHHPLSHYLRAVSRKTEHVHPPLRQTRRHRHHGQVLLGLAPRLHAPPRRVPRARQLRASPAVRPGERHDRHRLRARRRGAGGRDHEDGRPGRGLQRPGRRQRQVRHGELPGRHGRARAGPEYEGPVPPVSVRASVPGARGGEEGEQAVLRGRHTRRGGEPGQSGRTRHRGA